MSEVLCKHCDHFVTENECFEDDPTRNAKYRHKEDGEQDFDHDAEPGQVEPPEGWEKVRPDLFYEHGDDKTGPNSKYHSRVGKTDFCDPNRYYKK